jgi:hypothetical protein
MCQLVKVQYNKRPSLYTNERKLSLGKLFQQLCSNFSCWWSYDLGWHFNRRDEEYCAFCWIAGSYDVLIPLHRSSHKTVFFFEGGVSEVSNSLTQFFLLIYFHLVSSKDCSLVSVNSSAFDIIIYREWRRLGASRE